MLAWKSMLIKICSHSLSKAVNKDNNNNNDSNGNQQLMKRAHMSLNTHTICVCSIIMVYVLPWTQPALTKGKCERKWTRKEVDRER